MTSLLTSSGDQPLYLERQNAVCIGRVTGKENTDTRFAYYLHSRDDLFLGAHAGDGFEPQYALSIDATTMAGTVAAFHDLGRLTTELSIVGDALYDAHTIAQTGVLGAKQAHVYVLRDIYEFNQQDTAKILDIGYSTVSTHLADARRNANNALTFVEEYNELHERKETPA